MSWRDSGDRDDDARAAALVAVLCRPRHARACASAVALALARSSRRAVALVATVGSVPPPTGVGATPAARRVAKDLERAGVGARPTGRLVWLTADGDERGDGAREPAGEAPTMMAALATRVEQAVRALRLSAAFAVSAARTNEIDRTLRRCGALIVVRDPEMAEALLPPALESLRRLGPPVGVMEPPSRVGAALALAGAWAPPESVAAVDALWAGAGESDWLDGGEGGSHG